MIEQVTGDLFDSGCEALVKAVNVVGVMDGGIAAEFKRRFPDYFEDYAQFCEEAMICVGHCETYPTGVEQPRFIVSFPTKQHFRNPSEPEYIARGLNDLRLVIEELEIKSIAIPALGCGLGGLEWAEVAPLIHETLGDLSDCRVVVYEPQ